MDCVATAASFDSRSRRGETRSETRAPGRAPARRRFAAVCRGLICGLLVAGAAVTVPAGARSRDDAALGTIRAAELPVQGRTVLAAIRAGGPFAYPRDGITFANREGMLPREKRGYYAEYTVPTPGAKTRGARRIIAGKGSTGDFRTSGEYYYTDDHYESFRRIVQ
jgi:ribonuclease T1